MARQKVTAERCDNPDCNYEEVLDDSGEGATGYHFGVRLRRPSREVAGYWVLAGGGPIPAFYAHRKECIVPALEFAMSQAWRNE